MNRGLKKQIEKWNQRLMCVRKCECSHSVDYLSNRDYIVCTWCGRRIYKNDKIKFRYELLRRINERKDN